MDPDQHPRTDAVPAPERVRRGGQVLRGEAARRPTFDQLLLDARRPGDALPPAADLASTTSEAWRVLRIQAEFVEGFGTLDELFEALTLVQTGTVTRFPVVLVDSTFWGPVVDWIRGTLVERGMISPGDPEIFHVVETAEEAVDCVLRVCGPGAP